MLDGENGGVHPDRRRLSRRGGRGRARCPGKGRDPPHPSGAGRPKHATAPQPEPHRIDLVLADQNMPRLDGLGLTRKLRELPKFKTIPILILTTESSDQM